MVFVLDLVLEFAMLLRQLLRRQCKAVCLNRGLLLLRDFMTAGIAVAFPLIFNRVRNERLNGFIASVPFHFTTSHVTALYQPQKFY
jgi:hypothetical protein